MSDDPESNRSEQRFVLQERFEDFDSRNPLGVPRTWVVRYARTGDSTTEWKYECAVQSIAPKGR